MSAIAITLHVLAAVVWVGGMFVIYVCLRPPLGTLDARQRLREAAEHYEVSPSTAVIWVKCFRETGRCAAKPRGGSTSPLEKHADVLLALIEVEPDLTLDEVVCAMRENKNSWQPHSGLAVFSTTQDHLQKKACGRPSSNVRT